jgi:hypothetical protein
MLPLTLLMSSCASAGVAAAARASSKARDRAFMAVPCVAHAAGRPPGKDVTMLHQKPHLPEVTGTLLRDNAFHSRIANTRACLLACGALLALSAGLMPVAPVHAQQYRPASLSRP